MYIIVVFKKYNGRNHSYDCEVYEFNTKDEQNDYFFIHIDEWESKGYSVARYTMN